MKDTQQPTSTEVIKRLIAYTHNTTPDKVITRNKLQWFVDLGDGNVKGVGNPATDTDAALKLLHWLVNSNIRFGFWWCNKHWIFDSKETGNIKVPISGTPFCTAVCCLAERVLGKGGE